MPSSLLEKLNWDLEKYANKNNIALFEKEYLWSDDFNQEIDQWGKENICPNMYFGFQIISYDLPLHKDHVTVSKLNYILDTGGENVVTEWYDDDQTTLLQSTILEPFRWHIIKADTYHTVKNVGPNKKRFAITSRIFP